MNIKRFVAKDMREALREIRQSLGPDAVMLSSQPVEGGVEVIAAMDYDDSLLARMWEPDDDVGDARHSQGERPASRAVGRAASSDDSFEPRASTRDPVALGRAPRNAAERAAPAARFEPAAAYAELSRASAAVDDDDPDASAVFLSRARSAGDGAPPAARSPAPCTAFDAPSGCAAPAGSSRATPSDEPAPFATPAATVAPGPERSTELAHELKDLRELLQSQLASLAWNDLNRRNPVKTRMLRQLTKLGIDPELARELAARLPAATDIRDVWRTPLKLLSEKLLLSERELINLTGVLAVVGPTGVGKTTTIAKMAARFILRHGVNQLGLVSTDCYRVGAREQLMTFARIMGVPVHVAGNSEQLRQVLDTLRQKRLILIDTAGMSQRDVRLAGQFETLRVQGHKVRTVLTLSAATEAGSLRDMLEAFRSAAPKALIFTKIDEATTLGPMLSLALKSGLPLAYLSAGQRVPEDLYVAGRQRAWLIQKALRLAQNHTIETHEDELAEQFADLGVAANA